MTTRLQEIEYGTGDPGRSKIFYQAILGLDTKIESEKLNVFDTGISNVDFNTSTHLAAGVVAISFLTDDLQTVMDRLTANGISFDGPKQWHLNMISIHFKDPDGNLVRVNQSSELSPSWLTL